MTETLAKLPLHQVLVSHLVGGAGVVAIRLAAAAARHNFRCTGWVPGTGPASDALSNEGVHWRAYDLEAMKQGPARHLFACAQMWPGLHSLGVRPIVHVHNPTVYRYLVPVLRAARARVVVHFQIEPSTEEIDRALQFPPDHVIACARYIAEQIERRLPPGSQRPVVSAVPNSVDIERFTPGDKGESRRRAGLPTSKLVILMMANLAEHKGQATAIRATKALLDRGVPVECWLAGEDRVPGAIFEQKLRTLVSELGISDAVRFLGFRTDGPDLLRSCDVLLLPSTHEGLPLTVLEAQSAGIPVVGAPIPGIAEAVRDGETGLLVNADDYTGYADAVQSLYSNDALRRAITASARSNVIHTYSSAELERHTYDIYRSLS